MEKKYFKCGLRPVIQEISENFDTYYAYQWETGDFLEDMSYNHQINFDPSGDVEEISKTEFEKYVAALKKEKGLS